MPSDYAMGAPLTGPGGTAAVAAVAASARAEQYALAAGFLVAAVLLVAAWRRRRETIATLAAPSPCVERLLLAAILSAALVSRIAFAHAPWHPRWYFAQSTTLYAARALERSTLLADWLQALRTIQVTWPQDSAVFFPVSVWIQAWLGPSDRLPAIVGASWGTLGVFLAWLCGRALVSPGHGLLFAAFVAASPLQIAWSRLGSLPIAAVAHVLLVLWLAHRAGRRASPLLATVAGLATWVSLYHHFIARVALPIGAVSLAAGLRRSGCQRRRAVAAILAALAPCLVAGFLVARAGGQSIWPRYAGYVGSRGETTLGEVLLAAADNARRQLPTSLERYFLRSRAGDLPFFAWGLAGPSGWLEATRSGMAWGGLGLAPAAILGLVGLAVALRRPARHAVWLVVVLGGLALPVLGAPSARRFLIFDLGWCALAALGLSWLLQARPFAWLGRGTRQLLVVVIPAAIFAWSFATVLVLWRAVPWQHAHLPFGESGFGDGRACPGCVELGRRWAHDLGKRTVVVVVDTDIERENPTSPGGILLYGKLAARVAGRPEAFLDFYSLLRGFEVEHPFVRHLYDRNRSDAPRVLSAVIELQQPTAIAWDFVEPTQWEQELVRQLVAAGGLRQPLTAPPIETLAHPRPRGGIRVFTPWAQRAQALEALARHLGPSRAPEPPCVALTRLSTETAQGLVLALSDPRPAGERVGRPRWAVGSWTTVLPALDAPPVAFPVWEAVAITSREESPGVMVLGRDGLVTEVATADGSRKTTRSGIRPPVGPSCAARAGHAWWVVDPIAGTVQADPPPAWPLPQGPWIGVAALGENRLVLAGADQRLRVVDLPSGHLLADFAAVIPPSRRHRFAECSPLAAGHDWIAALDPLRSKLHLSADNGRPLGSFDLAQLLGVPGDLASAIGASNDHLAIGVANTVQTFALGSRAECR